MVLFPRRCNIHSNAGLLRFCVFLFGISNPAVIACLISLLITYRKSFLIPFSPIYVEEYAKGNAADG